MRRGECWRYQLRSIAVGPMVLISAQYLIDDPAVQMLYELAGRPCRTQGV